MRIGALAKRTGLSRDTIRFYERHGLIASLPGREPGNSYRDYPVDLVERLQMIAEAREAGMSVADLKLLIHQMEAGVDEAFDAAGFLDAKLAEVRRTIEAAQRFEQLLVATRSALDAVPVEWREPGVEGSDVSRPRDRQRPPARPR